MAVVELTTVGSVVSIVCVLTLLCVSSSNQQRTQRACRPLNVAGAGLMTAVCVVSVIYHAYKGTSSWRGPSRASIVRSLARQTAGSTDSLQAARTRHSAALYYRLAHTIYISHHNETF